MRRGFTLVELAVVIVILGITAAAVAPAFRDAAAGDPAQRGAAEVIRLLSRAQRAAVERGVPVTVMLVPPTASYTVSAAIDDSTEAVLAKGLLALNGGAELGPEPAPPRLRFQPDGTAQGDVIRVRAAGREEAIVVDRWTGEASVRNGEAGVHAP